MVTPAYYRPAVRQRVTRGWWIEEPQHSRTRTGCMYSINAMSHVHAQRRHLTHKGVDPRETNDLADAYLYLSREQDARAQGFRGPGGGGQHSPQLAAWQSHGDPGRRYNKAGEGPPSSRMSPAARHLHCDPATGLTVGTSEVARYIAASFWGATMCLGYCSWSAIT